MEFVAPLARIDPIYKEEEEAFKVRFAHKLVVSKTPLPPPPLRTSFSYPEPPLPFAHKLFVSRTPLPPLRISFSYPVPLFPLCAQAFRIQYPPPTFAHKLFVSSTPTSPLRISFSYPVPPSPLCAQASVSRREYPLVDKLLVKLI